MGIRKIRLARRAALFATVVAFALATGVLPSPAAAKQGGGHHGGGHHIKLHKGGHHAYRRGHRYAGVLGYFPGYRPYYARGAYYAPRRHAYLPRHGEPAPPS